MLVGFSAICLYETIYNFLVLNAQIIAGIVGGNVPDIDSLAIAYPDPHRPWNLILQQRCFLLLL